MEKADPYLCLQPRAGYIRPGFRSGWLRGMGQIVGVATITILLSGVVAGVYAPTAKIETGVALSGTLVGSTSVSGAMEIGAQLGGTLSGHGSASAIMTRGIELQGVLPVTGIMTARNTFVGVAQSFGQLNGILTQQRLLQGSLVGTGGGSAIVTLTQLLAGSCSGSESTTGKLSMLMGSINGLGTLAAPVTITNSLAGILAAAGNGSALLTQQLALKGTLAGLGAESGLITRSILLHGTCSGVGAMTGVFEEFSGVLSGVGGGSAALTLTWLLKGTTVGTSVSTGVITQTNTNYDLLLETGDKILQETGDKLFLESGVANTKISALSSATTPDDTEVTAVVQSSTTKKAKIDDLIGWKLLSGPTTPSGTTFTFSSIPQTFTDLLVVFDSFGAGNQNISMSLSGDNGSTYSSLANLSAGQANMTGGVAIFGYRMQESALLNCCSIETSDGVSVSAVGTTLLVSRVDAGINNVRMSGTSLTTGTISLYGR